MFSSLASSLKLPKFLQSSSSSASNSPDPQVIVLEKVEVKDVETTGEKRGRKLRQLVKAGRGNWAVCEGGNGVVQMLCSSYTLGATAERLTEVYERVVEEKGKEFGEEPGWKDSPGEITFDDWRDYLGRREYQQAYIDFFEDQLVEEGYDWRQVLEKFLFTGQEPLFNCLLGGLGHPLIHLAYAHEFASHTLAMEALTSASCFYSPLHKYLDDPAYSQGASALGDTSSTESLSVLLQRIRGDERFAGLDLQHDQRKIETLFEKREDALLEYWNAWDFSSNPKQQFEEAQRTVAVLLVSSTAHQQDMAQVLVMTHAMRALLPLISGKWQVSLLRQWCLLTLAVFVTQGRPDIDVGRVEKCELKDRGWKFVDDAVLNTELSFDTNFVKAIRALKVAGETWGDEGQFFLKAAVKFADEFKGWSGSV
ncbi:hypothetical protein K402DRAFT_333141 [Aulographum hederae CBS 113979]|uniref:Uncharacterized protein n=1 Tax=Aulographum hederae CBS 113979 TaxID=1176131 RepID=A0A6G1GZ73_9PEZI|nr:hypothetical protein K402DRAFT_333141 [Aulographum hederae CBS 113979]